MNHFARLATTFALLCASSGALAENYAIIVGVNACPEFQLPDGSKPRPLRGAENDADAIADLLTKHFDFRAENVQVLKGAAASHEGISKAFKKMAEKLKASDQFVFHFSGHGTQTADEKPFDELDRLDEALCTWDAHSDGTNLIRDDELNLWLDDLSASRITVILDCCHAGTGIKDVDDEFVPRYLPIRVEGKKTDSTEHWRELRGSSKDFGRQLTAFFACQANQQAYECRLLQYKPPRRMGQFTHYFIAGLGDRAADTNKDGRVSHREILSYVADKLGAAYNKDRKNPSDRQEPFSQTDFADQPIFQ